MYIMVVVFLVILLFIWFSRMSKKTDTSDWERKEALWFQELVTKFKERFPNQHFQIDESDPFIITVPPKHPAVRGLRIRDSGFNIIVEIGEFTHEHFDKAGLWDVETNWEGCREGLVLDVLFFVEDVFEDKIEFYGRTPSDGILTADGYQERGKKPRGFLNRFLAGKTTYVWSGPIEER